MFEDNERLSETPLAEWSDSRLRAVLGIAASRRDVAAAAEGDEGAVRYWSDLARTVAAERDSRAALAAAIDDSSAEVVGVWAAVEDQ